MPHQFDRIKQIDLQSRIQRGGAAALTEGELADTLGLSESQRDQIREKSEEVQKDLQRENQPTAGRRPQPIARRAHDRTAGKAGVDDGLRVLVAGTAIADRPADGADAALASAAGVDEAVAAEWKWRERWDGGNGGGNRDDDAITRPSGGN